MSGNQQLEERIAVLNERFDKMQEQLNKIKQKVLTNDENKEPNNDESNKTIITHVSNFQTSEPNDTPLIKTMKEQVNKLGFKFATFSQVPSDYYQRTLEERREILKTKSIHQLCKSLILENSKCPNQDNSNPKNPKNYLVIIQYTAKFNSKKLIKVVRDLNGGKLGKKQFVYSLADNQKAFDLTGFEFNGVSPIPLPTHEHYKIPIFIDKKIMDLECGQFWIGGGAEDWKILFNCDEFAKIMNPCFVCDITYDGDEEETDNE
ncbi:hypothetical protein ABK040_005898 [Willaertia magna]